MVFTSGTFLLFFAVTLAGLAILPGRTARQVWLLAASYWFYAYAKPSYALLLAAPTITGYLCAIRIEEAQDARVRKLWVTLNIAFNLGLLAYFKYTNFFLENVAALSGKQVRTLNIVLPIGISFYTFKILSYTIDVYRRDIKASRSLWRFSMFVSYFPELVAGPIVRATIFLPQMRRDLRLRWARFFIGLEIVLLGVTKKLVIADQLADLVDPVFRSPDHFSSATVISALVAYSIQIYCDFSGYSDMAIGLSKIIGFDLPENFNMPYLARSMTDFWRRWHITLSNWLRDYVFFSLGGIRDRRNLYRNVVLTMLLGGLWHGASWNFVFWGLLHGLALAVNQGLEAWRRARRRRPSENPAVKLFNWALTYSFVCFTWIFFRSPSFSVSMVILRKVMFLDPAGVTWTYWPLFMVLPIVVAGHAIGWLAARQMAVRPGRHVAEPPGWLAPLYREGHQPFALRPSRAAGIYAFLPFPSLFGAFVMTMWILGVCLFAAANASPFIYFQF
jgi:alginate O-acetyltransferase complex protein AlgI